MNNELVLGIVILILLVSAFIAGFRLVVLLGRLTDIFGFDEAKETYAKIISYLVDVDTDEDVHVKTHRYIPTLGYFNEFTNEYVEVDKVEIGKIANEGEEVKIQYTRNKMRLIDERWIKPNYYSFWNQAKLLIISGSIAIITFIVLIVLIITSN